MVNSPDTVLRFKHSLLCSQGKMDSLYLVTLHLIIYVCSTHGVPIDDDQALKPCPKITPFKKVNIDQLLGKWFLAIMVIESEHEEFVEDGVCIHGELLRYNKTTLRQVWNIDNPLLIGDHSAVIELPTIENEVGIWSIQSPLGGEITATIIDADPDAHLILAFCGKKGSDSLHMWTVVVTRQNGIAAPETLKLSAILVKHGYNPMASKIISWKNCPIYTMIP
ncbi:uncharacterized protein LOC114128378 [Aphis gossypii]|uniref:Uncharacterized protein n=1 Tax=Aphis gossypii TaxID=80765 RepID=A0A9P0JKG8_APHGO|nr:uncharacterized protein LOC114128378 [Aphis gossypii]CAH1738541.1 unnamed protein product [Aphis gossypii]